MRAVRLGVVAAVFAVAVGVAGPSPASADTRTISAVAVAPIPVALPPGPFGPTYRFDGVAVGDELGLAQVSFTPTGSSIGPCSMDSALRIDIVASDGSTLSARADAGTCTPGSSLYWVHVFLVGGHYLVDVTGGTGRYSGADGTGTMDLLNTSPVATVTCMLVCPVGFAYVASVSMQVTT
jgi:hypothetical protein